MRRKVKIKKRPTSKGKCLHHSHQLGGPGQLERGSTGREVMGHKQQPVSHSHTYVHTYIHTHHPLLSQNANILVRNKPTHRCSEHYEDVRGVLKGASVLFGHCSRSVGLCSQRCSRRRFRGAETQYTSGFRGSPLHAFYPGR